MLRQLDPGAHDLGLFGSDRRHVERIGHSPGEQIVRHLFGHLQGDVFLRLRGRGSKMGSADDVGQAKERVVGRGLDAEHIEPRPRHMAGSQKIGQRLLIHKSAARAVDDAHALLGLFEILPAQDVAGLIGERDMQRDEIGPCEQLVQLDLFHLHLIGLVLTQEWVIDDDFHLEAARAVADDAADIARADDPQGLVEKLYTHKAVFLPLSGMGRGRGLGQLSRDGEHHRDGMFGGGDHVAKWRVHDDHALLAGRHLVDVVGADARAGDHLEPVRMGEDLFRHLGGRADGETIIIADHLGELVLVLAKIGTEIHLDATITKDLDGGFGKFV